LVQDEEKKNEHKEKVNKENEEDKENKGMNLIFLLSITVHVYP